MDNPRLVGHIVSVQGFRVKVELLPESSNRTLGLRDGLLRVLA